jgi:hypothetical protein
MSRPRGYADWNPSGESARLVDQVQEVLVEYREQLPMTARQIFYRLVGAYGYAKTERAYKNLCEKLVRARRAEMIPFWQIRDDGTDSYGGGGWSSEERFWRSYESAGRRFQLDKMRDQPVRIELWCEAAGMGPMLADAVSDYDVSVYATGGFSSVSVTHEIADRAIASEKPTVFLHIGDFDPSGESIFDAMSEDAFAFVVGQTGDGERFEARRIALTADQVTEFDLPTAPPKASDSRTASWVGETCQAEAMPPDLLQRLAREAVEKQIDFDVLAETKEEEEEARKRINEQLDELLGGDDDEDKD